jgi:hypothetical protein
MTDYLGAIIDGLWRSGIGETVLLMSLIIMLALTELLSGIEGKRIQWVRRVAQLSTLPLGLLFGVLTAIRIVELL